MTISSTKKLLKEARKSYGIFRGSIPVGILGYVSGFRLAPPRGGGRGPGLLGDFSNIMRIIPFEHDTDGTDDNQSVLLLILEAKEYSTTFVVLVLL